jgi:hypothetical protein
MHAGEYPAEAGNVRGILAQLDAALDEIRAEVADADNAG